MKNFDETANPYVIGTKEIVVDEEKDHVIEVVECPFCGGIFGVDSTYLDQVDTVVHCPMCCMEVFFPGYDIYPEKILIKVIDWFASMLGDFDLDEVIKSSDLSDSEKEWALNNLGWEISLKKIEEGGA